MLTEQAGKSTSLCLSAALGCSWLDVILIPLPLVDKVPVVLLPGMKVFPEESQPGNKHAAQNSRLAEQEIQSAQPYPWAP